MCFCKDFPKKEDATNRDTVTSSLMDLTIPVLTSKNYDDWETQFSQLVSRENSTGGPGVSLDYLLCLQKVGTYLAVYESSRAEQLKNCMVFTGSIFKSDLITEAFNKLEQAGPAHTLNHQQKVQKFESILKETSSLDYAVNASREWNAMPITSKTFEAFYNIFSSSYNKRLAMEANTHSIKISSFYEGGRGGRGGRGDGRGRGRGGGSFGRYRGRDRGRG